MPDNVPVDVLLRLDCTGAAIAGTLEDDHGGCWTFYGWLELSSILESLRWGPRWRSHGGRGTLTPSVKRLPRRLSSEPGLRPQIGSSSLPQQVSNQGDSSFGGLSVR